MRSDAIVTKPIHEIKAHYLKSYFDAKAKLGNDKSKILGLNFLFWNKSISLARDVPAKERVAFEKWCRDNFTPFDIPLARKYSLEFQKLGIRKRNKEYYEDINNPIDEVKPVVKQEPEQNIKQVSNNERDNFLRFLTYVFIWGYFVWLNLSIWDRIGFDILSIILFTSFGVIFIFFISSLNHRL